MTSTKPDMVSRAVHEPDDSAERERRFAPRAPRHEKDRPATITLPCSACDQPATVSFAPRDGEPVYCNECFQPQPRSVDHVMQRNVYRPGGMPGPRGPRWGNGWQPRQGFGQRSPKRSW